MCTRNASPFGHLCESGFEKLNYRNNVRFHERQTDQLVPHGFQGGQCLVGYFRFALENLSPYLGCVSGYFSEQGVSKVFHFLMQAGFCHGCIVIQSGGGSDTVQLPCEFHASIHIVPTYGRVLDDACPCGMSGDPVRKAFIIGSEEVLLLYEKFIADGAESLDDISRLVFGNGPSGKELDAMPVQQADRPGLEF